MSALVRSEYELRSFPHQSQDMKFISDSYPIWILAPGLFRLVFVERFSHQLYRSKICESKNIYHIFLFPPHKVCMCHLNGRAIDLLDKKCHYSLEIRLSTGSSIKLFHTQRNINRQSIAKHQLTEFGRQCRVPVFAWAHILPLHFPASIDRHSTFLRSFLLLCRTWLEVYNNICTVDALKYI